MGISPDFTWAMVFSIRAFQSSGTMNMSTPAISAWAQSSLEQPATWPWPFQSPTTKPSKPIWSLSTSVSRPSWPCIFLPCQAENEAITVWAPASQRRHVAGAVDVAKIFLARPGCRPGRCLLRCRRRRGSAWRWRGCGPRPGSRRASASALDALDIGGAELGDHGGVFGVAFVGAAPAIVAHHGQGGREVPVEPGDGHFAGRGGADLADQVGVAGGAETDVVGEERGADHVVVAVDRVDAPENRDGGRAVVSAFAVSAAASQ